MFRAPVSSSGRMGVAAPSAFHFIFFDDYIDEGRLYAPYDRCIQPTIIYKWLRVNTTFDFYFL